MDLHSPWNLSRAATIHGACAIIAIEYMREGRHEP
jgi:hypothetical protein